MTGGASPLVRLPQCGAKTAKEILFQLQLEQFDHDEKYHREISRLSTHHRLNHMALHFAKYAGYLSDPDLDLVTLRRVVTDIFIIALSSLNVLNLRLSDKIDLVPAQNLGELGQKIAIKFADPPMTADALFRYMAGLSGQTAAACEKLDHIENYPFRESIANTVIEIAKGVLVFSSGRDWELSDMTRERLASVKQNSIFHGHR